MGQGEWLQNSRVFVFVFIFSSKSHTVLTEMWSISIETCFLLFHIMRHEISNIFTLELVRFLFLHQMAPFFIYVCNYK